MIKIFSALLLLALTVTSCDKLPFGRSNEPDPDAGIPLASINDSLYLYDRELEDLLSENSTAEDSARIIKNYRDNWIERQLFLLEASKKLQLDERDIERRLEDYKYQLIIYEYQKQYVNNNLNTAIPDSVIENYYQMYKENFVLKTNIVRGYFLKLPRNAPRLSQIRRWVSRGRSSEYDDIVKYANQHATYASLSKEEWIEFNDLILNTPFQDEITDEVRTLKRSRFLESKDDDYVYYYWILDYKTIDEVAPLQFAENQIRDILLNKRKVEMLKSLEDSIIKQARRTRLYKIYEN
jgi:hypothetical protein